MSARRTYLDYNATAPLRPQAREAMLAALAGGGNASSVHAEGRRARAMVETARAEVAALVGVKPAQVVFTSGATEAANWVLAQSWGTIVTSRIEHACISAPLAMRDGRIVELAVEPDGLVDLERLAAVLAREAAALDGRAARLLLVVQHANNETGVVQPIDDIVRMARDNRAAVLVDAVQSAGRVPLGAWTADADYLLVSSHKIGGPKGVGALVVRAEADLRPMLVGGGQERGHRAGTENVEAIAGFGAAAVAAGDDSARAHAFARMRDRLEAGLLASVEEARVIAGDAPRLPNTSLVTLPGARAETLVIAMDLAGIAVSAGAACASGKAQRSPVLKAMGVDDDLIAGAVRFSLGWATSDEDIETCIGQWQRIARTRRRERSVA